MKCLNCNNEMVNNFVHSKKNQISYDMCETCGSFWLDAGELDKMAFQVTGSIEYCSKEESKGIPESTRKCPRCKEVVLDKVFFIKHSNIVLDRCRNCSGFWLDGGELDLINKELQEIMPIKGKGFSEFIKNVHLPYWYKRIKKKSSETDFDLEVPPIKDAKFKFETEYRCPVCKDALNVYTIYGMEIEGCPKCKGIFLGKDKLRKLKDKSQSGSWSTLSWFDDEVEAIDGVNAILSKRICPKCKGVRLVTTNFGDSAFNIDWCPDCFGTWLDKDEFQGIVKHLSNKLSKLTSAEMKSKVYEEIKEIWTGPEDRISEILDAKAAISALINITIFEHPKICKLLLEFVDKARSIGL